MEKNKMLNKQEKLLKNFKITKGVYIASQVLYFLAVIIFASLFIVTLIAKGVQVGDKFVINFGKEVDRFFVYYSIGLAIWMLILIIMSGIFLIKFFHFFKNKLIPSTSILFNFGFIPFIICNSIRSIDYTQGSSITTILSLLIVLGTVIVNGTLSLFITPNTNVSNSVTSISYFQPSRTLKENYTFERIINAFTNFYKKNEDEVIEEIEYVIKEDPIEDVIYEEVVVERPVQKVRVVEEKPTERVVEEKPVQKVVEVEKVVERVIEKEPVKTQPAEEKVIITHREHIIEEPKKQETAPLPTTVLAETSSVKKQETETITPVKKEISVGEKQTIVSVTEFNDYSFSKRKKEWHQKSETNEQGKPCAYCDKKEVMTTVREGNKHVCYTCFIKRPPNTEFTHNLLMFYNDDTLDRRYHLCAISKDDANDADGSVFSIGKEKHTLKQIFQITNTKTLFQAQLKKWEAKAEAGESTSDIEFNDKNYKIPLPEVIAVARCKDSLFNNNKIFVVEFAEYQEPEKPFWMQQKEKAQKEKAKGGK